MQKDFEFDPSFVNSVGWVNYLTSGVISAFLKTYGTATKKSNLTCNELLTHE